MNHLQQKVNGNQSAALGTQTNATSLPPQIINLPMPPVMHPDKFAELIGLSSGVVGGWIQLGYLPTLKIGKYRMINLSALTAQCRSDIEFDNVEVVL